MSNPAKKIVVASTLVALALTPGCAKNEESIIVRQVSQLDADCLPLGVPSPRGFLDTLYGTPYTMAAVVQNRLLGQSADVQNSGTDNSELFLTEVDVDLTSRQSPELIDALAAANPAFVSFTVPLASTSLLPSMEGQAWLDPISAPASEQLNRDLTSLFEPNSVVTIEVHLVFKAERSGNSVGKIGEIESREFLYPIQICSGCTLVDCGGCLDANGDVSGACPTSDEFVQGGICGNAQDGSVLYPSTCPAPPEQ